MPNDAEFDFDLLEGTGAIDVASDLQLDCFCRPDWVTAVAAARGRQHEFVAVRSRRAGETPAYLFGGTHRRMGLRIFESMPMTGYGGWISDRLLSPQEERRMTSAWLAACRWPLVALTSKPGSGDRLPDRLNLTVPFLESRLATLDMETHVLDLSGDDTTLLKRVRPGIRSYLRRIDQLGFTFSSGTRELLGAFYDWYCRGSQDWQVTAAHLLPAAFFEALCQRGGMEVWLVHQEGRPAGAAAFLPGALDVQYQASGTQRMAGPVSAMDALIWHAARHYRDRGFRSMNMGASDGLDSVRRFKQKFGAVGVPYRRVTYLLPRLAALWHHRRTAVLA